MKNINLISEEFWVKITEFLQQNWALVEKVDDNKFIVYFIQDDSMIFDEIKFDTDKQAEQELINNGFKRYLDRNEKFTEFIIPPKKPFGISKRPIYSSGEFWIGRKIEPYFRNYNLEKQIIKVPNSNKIIGAIAGDVIGSVFERNNVKRSDFDLFNPKCDYTDDTVLTIAVADCIMNNKDFARTIWEYGRKYRGRGYGGSFKSWLQLENLKPYGSYGNGSAMRVSAVGFAFNDIETVLEVAKKSAEVTHSHPEGIIGAQATAAAIFFARKGKSKQEIKDYITKTFDYKLDFTLDEIRSSYKFDVTCQGSVPQAIVAFCESSDYESAIRLAISIGGDSDTIACITGGIASAFYKEIPSSILNFVIDKLPNEFIEIINKFDEQFE